MKITLNGKPHELEAALSLTALVEKYHLDPAKVAIEKNREIIPFSQYPTTHIADGDTIELVQFIGGG